MVVMGVCKVLQSVLSQVENVALGHQIILDLSYSELELIIVGTELFIGLHRDAYLGELGPAILD